MQQVLPETLGLQQIVIAGTDALGDFSNDDFTA